MVGAFYMNYVPKTKDKYIQAQSKLVSEALAGDLCRINVYPAQNRELWLLEKSYKAIGLIHRWLFFSDYLKTGKPEEKIFSAYTFDHLLKRAVNAGKAEHPGCNFIEFTEEALSHMAEREIIDLVVLDNGFLAACIKNGSKRTDDIMEGRDRYQKQVKKKITKRNNDIRHLKRCFNFPPNKWTHERNDQEERARPSNS